MVEDVFAISLSLTLTTETFDDAQSDVGGTELPLQSTKGQTVLFKKQCLDGKSKQHLR